MKVAAYDYELPVACIAQEPVSPRDSARLLVHDVPRDATRHAFVRDLPDVLAPGDLLVVNDTRVVPARVFGRRATGGIVEFLMLGPIAGRDDPTWRAMVKPARKLAPGETVTLDSGADVRMLARESDETGTGSAYWRVTLADGSRGMRALLEEFGRTPLPPYIHRERGSDPREPEDRERYQTVFARASGAVAAPTAGLHFTPELLGELAARGIERASVTLHVGLGTFLPVTVSETEDHAMHAEAYELTERAVRAVAECRARGGRVVAVGTTSVRVLESCVAQDGTLRAGRGETALFIEPGRKFRCVDALLTNFHLPRSTLLMLVAAFAGRERVLRLYTEAIERGYRFYSYGDATLFLARDGRAGSGSGGEHRA